MSEYFARSPPRDIEGGGKAANHLELFSLEAVVVGMRPLVPLQRFGVYVFLQGKLTR